MLRLFLEKNRVSRSFKIIPGIRRHMDETTAMNAMKMVKAGQSQRSVALQLGYSRTSIQNLCNRYKETGNVCRRPGTGKGPVLKTK